eukprot:CAMPEP_0197534688 /NCGR_PEP_ID=MMETSP1318-20131121/48006_1 /TAXON_ID=552666 /ORGANISM="Partenskyella glossopodia, Strain RCC365" /LENGTH=455 /DNA_ID=CAMNT_0043092047 /DNA_START=73 /DNA_END=1440 /DNA_ORIENTATION=-
MSFKGRLASNYFYVTHSLQGVDFWSEIVEGRLWLGNLAQAKNETWLKEKGITHICSVTQWGDGTKFFPKSFSYLNINIEDKPGCNILTHLSKAVTFIDQAMDSDGKVYVHCNQGRSRSSTVIVAYFVYKYQLDVKTALERVRAKRSIVCPNEGFMKQLELWHSECRKHVITAIAPVLKYRLHDNTTMNEMNRIGSLMSDYVYGPDVDVSESNDKKKKAKKASVGMKMVANMATYYFKMTHKLQGIPMQNNIIPDKLWLGQLGAAQNYKWLSETGITRVCSVTQWGQATRFHEQKGVEYHVIQLEDKPHCPILDHLDEAVEFVGRCLRDNHKVLVHCNQGRSRSATVMTAFFIKTFGCRKPVKEHVEEIKNHRSEVCPNSGFMKQLEIYRLRCIAHEEVQSFFDKMDRNSKITPHEWNDAVEKIAQLISGYYANVDELALRTSSATGRADAAADKK